jgi:hypothetical protein
MKTSEEGIKLIKHFRGGPYNRPIHVVLVCGQLAWVMHYFRRATTLMNLAERDSFKLKPEDDRIWTNEEVDGLT